MPPHHFGAGWLESTRRRTYSPLSSRAKRGDPVNKKALRANARRHIALDCHSRTTTFSTLVVLLRNDRELCADNIYTLTSPLYTLSIPRHGAELTQMPLAFMQLTRYYKNVGGCSADGVSKPGTSVEMGNTARTRCFYTT